MSTTLTPYQVNVAGATWVDVNTLFTQNAYPDRLPDLQSIMWCSLVNLFNCPIGARGRIFQPTYGSMWYQFLQEPVDEVTAAAMRIAMIQSIQLWEPRITLDMNNTYITPVLSLPGYTVRISATYNLTGQKDTVQFNTKANPNG